MEVIVKKPERWFRLVGVQDPAPEAPEVFEATVPSDPVAIAAEQGVYKLSFMCAHCHRWYDGRKRGLKERLGGPRCSSPKPCAGLPARMGYPGYVGPLTQEQREQMCALCGERSDKIVKTGDDHVVGYCIQHFELAMRLLEGR